MALSALNPPEQGQVLSHSWFWSKNGEMLALSIRQPYAELILRGIKTVEYRSQPARIIGERFYIYPSKAKAVRPIWSDDLRVATPPGRMIELDEQVGMGPVRPRRTIDG